MIFMDYSKQDDPTNQLKPDDVLMIKRADKKMTAYNLSSVVVKIKDQIVTLLRRKRTVEDGSFPSYEFQRWDNMDPPDNFVSCELESDMLIIAVFYVNACAEPIDRSQFPTLLKQLELEDDNESKQSAAEDKSSELSGEMPFEGAFLEGLPLRLSAGKSMSDSSSVAVVQSFLNLHPLVNVFTAEDKAKICKVLCKCQPSGDVLHSTTCAFFTLADRARAASETNAAVHSIMPPPSVAASQPLLQDIDLLLDLLCDKQGSKSGSSCQQPVMLALKALMSEPSLEPMFQLEEEHAYRCNACGSDQVEIHSPTMLVVKASDLATGDSISEVIAACLNDKPVVSPTSFLCADCTGNCHFRSRRCKSLPQILVIGIDQNGAKINPGSSIEVNGIKYLTNFMIQNKETKTSKKQSKKKLGFKVIQARSNGKQISWVWALVSNGSAAEWKKVSTPGTALKGQKTNVIAFMRADAAGMQDSCERNNASQNWVRNFI